MNNKNNEKDDKQPKCDRTENQMIKIAKNLASNHLIFEDKEEKEENFSNFFDESIRKQMRYECFYLMNFDILSPIISHKIGGREKLFYHQKIFINNMINNIDYKKYENFA